MPEVCTPDLLDEDCDGMINEGCACTEDVVCGEFDTVPCSLGVQRCVGGVLNSECEGEVRPQDEMCDGIDNDCNGEIDEGVLTSYFRDSDRDGVGVGAAEFACEPPGTNFALVDGDCNDDDDDMFPGNPEVCDGKDNDCNTMADDGLPLFDYFFDEDDDTYGDPETVVMECGSPGGEYIDRGGDCMDMDDAINPDTSEDCDLIDNNCSGTPDDGGVCRTACLAHVHNGHVYQFCREERNWTQARNRCDDMSGSNSGLYVLATIDDMDENDSLSEFARSIDGSRSWWIGLTDSGSDNEGNYRWVSGTDFSFTNWDGGEPNDDGTPVEDCAEMRGSGQWNDFPCGNGRYFICEEAD